TVRKCYQAIVVGAVPAAPFRIAAPIARHPRHRERMTVNETTGRDALTEVLRVAPCGPFSLLEIRLHTGRTHQIRVHLRSRGIWVVGDWRYAPRQPVLKGRLAALWGGGIALHAGGLAFTHPVTGRRMQFHLPLPEDMARFLAEAGWQDGISSSSEGDGLNRD
ncbi:hypothetical protein JW905_15790, partial [bacterium]|nr:hypothetical protein [candidate division CSSED10-310 bacterium]